ncbi:MAG: hypothetical protein JSW61_04510 [Candidatus Thorarchaeota archaeon]|nr:MAG: hypothetical protein JSW61_04510 [Candidatus Thorarchaeota archaeon]
MLLMKGSFIGLTIFALLGLITSGTLVTSPAVFFAKTPAQSLEFSQENIYTFYQGGTLDSIQVVRYETLSDALAAVNSGDADLFGHLIEPEDYDLVGGFPDLNLQWAHDTRITMLAINAGSHLLGNYHLRRAIAFAINKTELSSNSMNGIVDPVDFLVPLNNEFSPEESDGGLFYDSDIGQAHAELAAAGMLDVDSDGVVEGPDGSEFQFGLWYPEDVSGYNASAQAISSDLFSVGINNTLVPMNFSTLQSQIGNHTLTYDLALYEEELPRYGFEWAATTFEYDPWPIDGKNIANVNDEVLNSIATEFIASIDLDEIKSNARNMLVAVRDRCPVIPLFAHRWLSVYNDVNFEDWVDETNGGAFSIWNPVSISVRPGAENELVVAVLSDFFNDFFTSLNPFGSGTAVDQDWLIKQFNPYMLVYDSPLATMPDGTAVPRHATSWEMLFLGQVSDLAAHQTRARFYCDSQATWTDGVQMNAEDYRFTYEFYANNSLVENPTLIEEVKVTGDYIAGVTYNTRDIFSYRILGSLPILPQHIWEGMDPETWSPTVQDSLGSGPFTITAFTSNSSLTMSRNNQYYPEADTSPPTLLGITIIPENPIPADSVVFRVFVDDRSRVSNVTLDYVYSIGQINFTESQLMILGAQGYEATIPARVTANAVTYEITATDFWGNSAVIAEGSYSRQTTSVPGGLEQLTPYFVGISLVLAVLAIVVMVVIYRELGS